MMYRKFFSFLAIAALAACAETADEAAPADDSGMETASADMEALAELGEYWVTHYNMGHAEMVASRYTEDAFSLGANGSILEGRAAIEADMAATMAASSPTASVEARDRMVFGDYAVSIGTYAVEGTAEGGESMTFGGAWMNVHRKVDGEWMIAGSVANYDAAPPEGWAWAEGDGEEPAEEGAMGEVIASFMDAWNSDDAEAVAGHYTQDAQLSFSNGPWMQGRAAIQAEVANRLGTAENVVIHDVGTQELAEGWAVDGGWYEVVTDAGDVVQAGAYMNLMQLGDDGFWRTHWGITNAQPVSGM